MSANRYTMLLTSLPHLSLPRSGGTDVPFEIDRPPINRVRLDRRLAWLQDDDHTLLMRIETALAWERLELGATDRELVRSIEELLRDLEQQGETVLRRLVQDRYEIRTLVAALRRRLAGEPPPEPDEAFGDPQTTATVRQNWGVQAFRQGAVHSWLPTAERLLRADDPVGLERLLVRVSWNQLEQRRFGHSFDFIAVVVWLLQWGLIERCARHDPKAAADRFQSLLDAAGTDHPLRLSETR